jgi:hypothetical protein
MILESMGLKKRFTNLYLRTHPMAITMAMAMEMGKRKKDQSILSGNLYCV